MQIVALSNPSFSRSFPCLSQILLHTFDLVRQRTEANPSNRYPWLMSSAIQIALRTQAQTDTKFIINIYWESKMNWDRIEGNWKQIRGNLIKHWGFVCGNPLNVILEIGRAHV